MRIRQSIRVTYSVDYSINNTETAEIELVVDGENFTTQELEEIFSGHNLARFTRVDLAAWRAFKDKHLTEGEEKF